MPNHLVLALETLPPLCSWAALHWAVMRTCGGVDIGVRVQQILRLKGRRRAALESTNEALLRICDTIDTGCNLALKL